MTPVLAIALLGMVLIFAVGGVTFRMSYRDGYRAGTEDIVNRVKAAILAGTLAERRNQRHTSATAIATCNQRSYASMGMRNRGAW